MKKKIESFEDLDVYRLAEDLGDRIWFGRFHFAENRQFVRISRGSLYETRHWLHRAFKRELLKEEEVKELRKLFDELAPRLNAYIRSIGRDKTNDQ
jgi:hypothetical protein